MRQQSPRYDLQTKTRYKSAGYFSSSWSGLLNA